MAVAEPDSLGDGTAQGNTGIEAPSGPFGYVDLWLGHKNLGKLSMGPRLDAPKATRPALSRA